MATDSHINFDIRVDTKALEASPLQVGKSERLAQATEEALKQAAKFVFATGGVIARKEDAASTLPSPEPSDALERRMLHGPGVGEPIGVFDDDEPDWEVDTLASYGEELYNVFVNDELVSVGGLVPLSDEAQTKIPLAGDTVRYDGDDLHLERTKRVDGRWRLFLDGLDEDEYTISSSGNLAPVEDRHGTQLAPGVYLNPAFEPPRADPVADAFGRLMDCDWDQDSLVAAIQEADDA